MVQNPPDGMHRIIPYLLYGDAAAAIEFLCNAYGFTERMRFPGPDGKVMHAEIERDGHVLMLASAMPQMGHADPRTQTGRTCGICVYVDDVDAHFAHAKEQGAEILSEPADQFYGDRTYRTLDCGGHEWNFMQHIRDVPPEEMNMPEG